MKILGIETSCDETAVAIVEDGTKILTNIISSSKELHDKTGGIIPEVAAREQVRCMIPVLNESMRQCSNATMEDIDAIAVTTGPGLIGSLLIGVETAKTLSFVSGKPIIPINHIFAHIYANWLTEKKKPEFPAIALIISGGHTELFFMKNHHELRWIGGTLDDASGEAFDKTARLLGLGYPGGPEIARIASEYKIHNTKYKIQRLPRPMLNSKDLNMSFSGLKTAIIREVARLKQAEQFNDNTKSQLAYEVQESITDILVAKTISAAEQYNVKSILLGGGVAANQRLTEKMKSGIKNLELNIQSYIPSPNLCTDNGAAIASFAYFHNHPVPWKDVQADPDVEIELES